MKFIIGEGGWNMLERLSYRGGIGLFFNDTLTGMACYAIFGLTCILAVIGLLTVLKWIIIKPWKKKKETPEERWLRTGR